MSTERGLRGPADGPDQIVVLDERTVAPLLPAREARAHKGSHGRVLVVAGSLEYAGAALLAAEGAARAGAGLVTLALPSSLQRLLAGRLTVATTLALPERDGEGTLDPAAAADRIGEQEHEALVMGPGLPASSGTVELVLALLRQPGPPAVLDAEALNSLARSPPHWAGLQRSCVLTPHPGEFRRLRPGQAATDDSSGAVPAELVFDDARRATDCRAAAREWGQVVVLKGGATVVASPDGAVCRAPFENPALATAGTGDVLAGAIGSLLAQGLGPFDAARLGVFLHGLAGEAVRERLGDAGLLASDLPLEIALARRHVALVRDRITRGHRVGFMAGRVGV